MLRGQFVLMEAVRGGVPSRLKSPGVQSCGHAASQEREPSVCMYGSTYKCVYVCVCQREKDCKDELKGEKKGTLV